MEVLLVKQVKVTNAAAQTRLRLTAFLLAMSADPCWVEGVVEAVDET